METTEGSGILDYYVADVVAQNDFYPFGMKMPNTSDLADEAKYRYKFNGKEVDPEVYGNGNIYDYGFRIYNPRLGKFLSQDPLTSSYPWYTPYQFAGNTPIMAIDLDGLEEFIMIDQGNKYYKCIWDISARKSGEGGTIMYVGSDGSIEQDVRNLNGLEKDNKAISERLKYAVDSPNIRHHEDGTSVSEGFPSTVISKGGQGEFFVEKEGINPPPPAGVKEVSPNTGGNDGDHPPTGEELKESKQKYSISQRRFWTEVHTSYWPKKPINKDNMIVDDDWKKSTMAGAVENIQESVGKLVSKGYKLTEIELVFHTKKDSHSENTVAKLEELYPDAKIKVKYKGNNAQGNSIILSGKTKGKKKKNE